jgi:hypothetical protein
MADDGTLLNNHARLNPLYMVAFDQSPYQGFAFGLADRAAPRAALRNINQPYAALVYKPFPLPGGAPARSAARTRRSQLLQPGRADPMSRRPGPPG